MRDLVKDAEAACCENPLELAIVQRERIWGVSDNTDKYYNYILVDNETPVYVGYSSAVGCRIGEHCGSHDFEHAIILSFDNEESARLNEKALIRSLAPKGNTIKYTGRSGKMIDGEIVQVKYKAFRLPLALINKLNIVSAKSGISLEEIAYMAFTEYLANP